MNISRKIGFILIFMISVFALISCDGSKPYKDLTDYITGLKESKTDSLKKAVKLRAEEPVKAEYKAANVRSPFQIKELATTKKDGESANPLQAYPLDMLRFVGTVTQNSNTFAFILSPDGRIYQIRVGDIIGDKKGKVINIDADKISLMEPTTESGNSAMKRVITLQLKETN